MKRIALVMAIILLFVIAVGGCTTDKGKDPGKEQDSTKAPEGVSVDKSGEKPNVRVWIKKSFSADADNALIERLEEYGKNTGTCDVTVEMIPNANFGEKYSVAVESGEVPDVAYMTLYLLRQYYDAGLLLDTEDLLADIELKGHKLSTQSIAAATFDGKAYAIPYYLSSTAILYRKDYLEQAGWKNPPETWEEFRQCSKDVTEKVPDVYGAGFAFGKCPDTENAGRSALFSLGGHLFDKDGNISTTDPETLDALQWICDLYSVDKSVPPTAVSWDDAGNNKAFMSGQVAMIINAASLTMDLQKPENAELAEKTGVANMPSGPAGTLVCSGPQCLSIFKMAKNVDLAKEIIKYNMEYDWYKGWVEEMRFGVQPAYEDIRFDHPYILPYIHANDNLAWQGYPGPYTGLAAKAWSSFELSNFFQRVLVDKISVKEAAEEMGKRIEQLK